MYERSVHSQRAEAVYVATDDPRIADHVRGFGGKVVSPEGNFQSGTDRIAAALATIGGHYDVVVNVQGDEPLIEIGNVDALIDLMDGSDAEIGTLACRLVSDEEFLARDVVKVVTDVHGRALYFSRAPIGSRDTARRHIGVYAYRAAALSAMTALAPSSLELAESLEQLRALEHGFKIVVHPTSKPHLGVDRPEDVRRVEEELEKVR